MQLFTLREVARSAACSRLLPQKRGALVALEAQIGGNNLNTEQLEELQTALPDTEMYLAARGEPTGSTWREHPHYFEMRDFFGMYYMAGGTNGVDENGNQIIIAG